MIFVDSWAWIALAIRKDQYHAIAAEQHKRFQSTRRKYVTTEHVLSETITFLYGKAPVDEAQTFLRSLFASIDNNNYLLVPVTSQQFRRAWDMRQKYDDKPDISFVDFTSMIVMQDLEIKEVFSGDKHFEQVGLGFQLFPK